MLCSSARLPRHVFTAICLVTAVKVHDPLQVKTLASRADERRGSQSMLMRNLIGTLTDERVKMTTHEKALQVNLDPTRYGTFAEIGAGQEVARWFFRVGADAETIS